MWKSFARLLAAICALFLLISCGTAGGSHDRGTTSKNDSAKKERVATDESAKEKEQAQNDENNQSSRTETNGDQKAITVVNNPSSILVLVNKTHKLPDGYAPKDLVYPNVRFPYKEKIEKRKLRAVAAHALEEMFAAADRAGITLYGESGYRSYDRQVAIYEQNVKTLGKDKAAMVSAYPGTSEHQTGLAIDITSADMLSAGDPLTAKFGETKAGKWVAANAYRFGFIIRYPKGKENITGYEYEPWHIRYVGKKAAKYIHDHNITLEQYVEADKVNK